MAIEVFNRYEHKYLLEKDVFEKVIDVMDAHMTIDKYNIGHLPYTIANVYYDTPDDYLIRHSLSSPDYKEKLRLRAYGIPKGDEKVYAEIKKKCGGIVNKRRTAMQINEAYDFLRTGRPPPEKDYMNAQVVKELSYFFSRRVLLPKVYIAYDRIAYFENGNPDLRISFDTNIRARRYDLRLETGDYGEKLFEEDVCLMEIKTALAKPLWLTSRNLIVFSLF